MPSTSAKQHRFMAAIANNPSFAKKVGVSQSVGKDFNAADKGKTFNKGGMMKESKGMVGKEMAFMKKKGAPKSMIKHEKAEMGMLLWPLRWPRNNRPLIRVRWLLCKPLCKPKVVLHLWPPV